MARFEIIDLNPYVDYKIILTNRTNANFSTDCVIHFTSFDSAYSITSDGYVRLSSYRYPDLMIHLKEYD